MLKVLARFIRIPRKLVRRRLRALAGPEFRLQQFQQARSGHKSRRPGHVVQRRGYSARSGSPRRDPRCPSSPHRRIEPEPPHLSRQESPAAGPRVPLQRVHLQQRGHSTPSQDVQRGRVQFRQEVNPRRIGAISVAAQAPQRHGRMQRKPCLDQQQETLQVGPARLKNSGNIRRRPILKTASSARSGCVELHLHHTGRRRAGGTGWPCSS